MTLTPSQIKARAEFDLDTAMAQLPKVSAEAWKEDGSIGYRPRILHSCTISEELLKEYAKTDLGAERVSKGYLNTLRMLVANQYDADKWRYRVEISQRTNIGTPRTMRTILSQMQGAGLVQAHYVKLGKGKSQTVYTYGKAPRPPVEEDDPRAFDMLEESYREHEGEQLAPETTLQESEVPY